LASDSSWYVTNSGINLGSAFGRRFLPDRREMDDQGVARVEIFVDTGEVITIEDGDLAIPLAAGFIALDDVCGDMYQRCCGDVAGRAEEAAITLFENGGDHLELVTAEFLRQLQERR
jgi:ornithine cyclodeaminase/alanine dehydrogenase-like protein (mu-crystallin family)